MKALSQVTLFFFFICLVAACKNSPEGEAAKTGEAKTTATAPASAVVYNVNTAASQITWTGSKPTGSTHTGTINITDGQLSVSNGNIASGSFTIDMNSIANKDLPDEKKGDLEGHLKSGDFFDVENHPTGKFVIASVEPVTDKTGVSHRITGNLTMRGITKSVTFDANVKMLSNMISAVTPSFTINRTNWDVNFNSGILGTVKDRLISDDIALVINLQASPSDS